MSLSLELLLLIGVLLLGAVVVLLVQRNRTVAVADPEAGKRGRGVDDIDTVIAWPPEVTRL